MQYIYGRNIYLKGIAAMVASEASLVVDTAVGSEFIDGIGGFFTDGAFLCGYSETGHVLFVQSI